MKNIVTIHFGSHLYGTNTPNSDMDYKQVHLPDAKDILLGKAKGSINTNRVKSVGEKNVAGEIDTESYSLQKFFSLISEGQTVSLDVLFAPAVSIIENSRIWNEIVANRQRFVSRKSSAFVGYCKQQANKYGIKGSRVAAARNALIFLDNLVEKYGTQVRLGDFADLIPDLCNNEFISIVPIIQASGVAINHLEVCGLKLSYNASIKHGRDVITKLVENYGTRAIQAEKNNGCDWKALSHAVRIGNQAIELFNTGHVTFPLPNKEHILAIKTGQISFKEVAEEIEQLLELVEKAAVESSLPEEPDHAWIHDFVANTYGQEVRNSFWGEN